MQEVWLEFPTEICDFLNVFPRQEKPDRQVRGIGEGKGSVGTGGLPAQMPNTKDRLTIVDVALAAGNCNY